ncbi:MAG: hypothetical protein JNK74_11235 [Candidatus Hydrogenedentes bacterium]|nr:hypothetical protein [Candidatus Hydrogenedentota bacterium]
MSLFPRVVTVIACLSYSLVALAASGDPRYIFLNVAYGSGEQRGESEADFRATLTEISRTIGASEREDMRVGVSWIFSVLNSPMEQQTRALHDLLRASEATGVPVLIVLDGQNWWENRPELWNWWDPARPGYDPANVQNVEWCTWDPSGAVKIGWRNWGRQLRVAPAQNIMSPKVLNATLEPMKTLLGIVEEWRRALPPARAHLFGGVKLGWEASIGYNAFYYPDGNQFAEKWPAEETHDPVYGLDATKGLSGGLAQLGYAAVKSAGIKSEGVLTRDDLGEVVRRYLGLLAKTAADAGLPPEKVYVHEGGTLEPFERHIPFSAAFNEWSTPGWSIYWKGPADMAPIEEAMAHAGRTRWAAVEWLWPGQDRAAWAEHFVKTFQFRDCRHITVYNWEGIESDLGALEAIQQVVGEWKEPPGAR